MNSARPSPHNRYFSYLGESLTNSRCPERKVIKDNSESELIREPLLKEISRSYVLLGRMSRFFFAGVCSILAVTAFGETIFNPSVGSGSGSIQGVVTDASLSQLGAFQTSVSLKMAPERSGLQIYASFNYNSHTGLSPMGMGWNFQPPSLSLSLRTRNSNPIWISSLEGELAELESRQLRPRISQGSSVYEQKSKDTWVRRTSDGGVQIYRKLGRANIFYLVREYGSACLDISIERSSQCLSRIDYDYLQPTSPSNLSGYENNTFLVQRIQYNFTPQGPLSRIEFVYEDLGYGAIPQFSAGELFYNRNQLVRVRSEHLDEEIETIKLFYNESQEVPLLQRVESRSGDMSRPTIFFQYTQAGDPVRKSLSGSQEFKVKGVWDSVDIDGDSVPELVISPLKGSSQYFRLKSSSNPDSSIEIKPVNDLQLDSIQSDPARSQLLDFDGDGVVDYFNAATNQLGINKAGKIVKSFSQKMPIAWVPNRVFPLEFNGDQFADYLVFEGSSARVFLHNSETGWNQEPLSAAIHPIFIPHANRKFVDFNGDGITDFMSFGDTGFLSQSPWVIFGTGKGFTSPVPLTVENEETWRRDLSLSKAKHFVDVDQDGLMDVVVSHNGQLFWWRNVLGSKLVRISLGATVANANLILSLDVNSDGQKDPMICNPIFECEVHVSTGEKKYLLSSVQTSEGVWTKVHYTPVEKFNSESQRKTPLPLQMVQTIHSGDRITFQKMESFQFRDFIFSSFYGNHLGVEGRKVSTQISSLITGDTLKSSAEFTYHGEDGVKAGRLHTQSQRFQSQTFGNSENHRTTLEEVFSTEGKGFFLQSESSQHRVDYGDSPVLRYETRFFDTLGQLVRSLSRGQGKYLEQTTEYEYLMSELPQSQEVFYSPQTSRSVRDGSGSLLNAKKIFYESSGLRRKTKETLWQGDKDFPWIEQSFSYLEDSLYPFLVREVRDGKNGKIASYEYDDYGLYQTKTINGEEEVTSLEMDFARGLLKRKILPTGLITENTYDTLGQLTRRETFMPGHSKKIEIYSYKFAQPKILQPRSAFSEILSSDSNQPRRQILAYLDFNDQVLSETETGPRGRLYVRKQSVFLDKNLLIDELVKSAVSPCKNLSQCQFRFAAGIPRKHFFKRLSGTLDRMEWTQEGTEESRQRLVVSQEGLNVIEEKVRDRNGSFMGRKLDAFGNEIEISHFSDSGRTSWTQVKYSPLGQALEVYRSGKLERSYTYSGTGSLMSSWGVEFGSQIQRFDERGRVARELKPMGQEGLFTYDRADRIVRETYTKNGQIEENLSYDFGKFGRSIGKLHKVEQRITAGETQSFSHDEFGRIESRQVLWKGGAVDIFHKYNAFDALAAIEVKDRKKVTFVYDDFGYLESIPGLARELEFDGPDKIQRVHFESGGKLQIVRDPVSDRISSKAFDGRTLSWKYDPVGNVVEESSNLKKKVFGYGSHDSTYRLQSYFKDSTSPGVLWKYSENGDRETNHKPLTNAKGEIVRLDTLSDISWSSRGQVKSLSVQGESLSHQSVRSAQLRLMRLGDHEILNIGSAVRLVDGRVRIIVEDRGELLGEFQEEGPSGQVIVSGLQGHPWLYGGPQGVFRAVEWSPWGEIETLEGSPFLEGDLGYSRSPVLAQGKVVFLGARAYFPKEGRFLSPDPLLKQSPKTFLSDSLQWNGYAYGRNNPLGFQDPEGEFAAVGAGLAFGLQFTIEAIDLYSRSRVSKLEFSDFAFAAARIAVATALGGMGDWASNIQSFHTVAKLMSQSKVISTAVEHAPKIWIATSSILQNGFNNLTVGKSFFDNKGSAGEFAAQFALGGYIFYKVGGFGAQTFKKLLDSKGVGSLTLMYEISKTSTLFSNQKMVSGFYSSWGGLTGAAGAFHYGVQTLTDPVQNGKPK